jgi:hypothetical protein
VLVGRLDKVLLEGLDELLLETEELEGRLLESDEEDGSEEGEEEDEED